MSTKKKTPKQTIAKINALLKGIDNSVLAIDKHKTALSSALKEAKSLMGGIGNIATQSTNKPPAKAAKPAKPAKAAKSAKPAKPAKPAKVAKSAKPAKVAKPAKPAKPAKVAKPAKPTKTKPAPVDGRPNLKDVVKQIVSTGGPLSAAEIWKTATDAYGYWSRQSLYNILNDKKVFSRDGNKFALQNSSVDEEEADKFCKQVESSAAVSNVQ